jgi:hypothetical protein
MSNKTAEGGDQRPNIQSEVEEILAGLPEFIQGEKPAPVIDLKGSVRVDQVVVFITDESGKEYEMDILPEGLAALLGAIYPADGQDARQRIEWLAKYTTKTGLTVARLKQSAIGQKKLITEHERTICVLQDRVFVLEELLNEVVERFRPTKSQKRWRWPWGRK